MPRQIMVPLDGSRFSEQALSYAMGAAAHSHARVHLTRVHSDALDVGLTSFPASFPVSYDEGQQRELRASERAYLQGIAAPWIDAGIDVCIANPYGPAATALAAYAEAAGIDLVVMTSHGRGGLSRAWLGSVADRLIRSTNVPVLLLRPLAAMDADLSVRRDPGFEFRPAHILIPLDGSDLSESIIAPALRVGSLAGARYTLTQIVQPPVEASPDVTAHFAGEADNLRDAASAYLDAWAARLRARGFAVETSVVMQSNSAAGIVEEALYNECDMIAMATHGRSGWTRVMLGSVADKVLRTSPTPLLTLRPAMVGALL